MKRSDVPSEITNGSNNFDTGHVRSECDIGMPVLSSLDDIVWDTKWVYAQRESLFRRNDDAVNGLNIIVCPRISLWFPIRVTPIISDKEFGSWVLER